MYKGTRSNKKDFLNFYSFFWKFQIGILYVLYYDLFLWYFLCFMILWFSGILLEYFFWNFLLSYFCVILWFLCCKNILLIISHLLVRNNWFYALDQTCDIEKSFGSFVSKKENTEWHQTWIFGYESNCV